MGRVEPIVVGELSTKAFKAKGKRLRTEVRRARAAGQNPRQIKRKGKIIWVRTVVVRRNRIWLSPCHDWTAAEQAAYIAEHDLPRNPIKLALGMSGECFCGAFASPGELDRIRRHAPDVGEEIDRLAVIARENGQHDKWGTRKPTEKGLIRVKSGPLCSGCTHRAAAAGLLFN